MEKKKEDKKKEKLPKKVEFSREDFEKLQAKIQELEGMREKFVRAAADFENAKKTYRDIVALDDPFWSKIALERVREIDLNLRLKRT